jgi:hypothetical protein
VPAIEFLEALDRSIARLASMKTGSRFLILVSRLAWLPCDLNTSQPPFQAALYGSEDADAYSDLFGREWRATAADIRVGDLRRVLYPTHLFDDIHPNLEGHRRLAAAVAPILLQALEASLSRNDPGQ